MASVTFELKSRLTSMSVTTRPERTSKSSEKEAQKGRAGPVLPAEEAEGAPEQGKAQSQPPSDPQTTATQTTATF